MTAPEQMLKPCPFCGGEAKLKAWSWPYDRFRVQCAACRCQASGLRADPEDAITAWNTRPATDELVEALEEIANTLPGRTWVETVHKFQEIARTALRNTGAAL